MEGEAIPEVRNFTAWQNQNDAMALGGSDVFHLLIPVRPHIAQMHSLAVISILFLMQCFINAIMCSQRENR